MAVIGDLVANLTANTAGFTAPLGKAQGVLSRFASAMVGGGGFGAGMAVFNTVAGIAGSAFDLLSSGLSSSVASAQEAVQAERKLGAVLASTGGAAGVTSDEIKKLANDLMQVTDFGDDATISAAGVLATFTNIKGDMFKGAIVAAQDLSSVMGQDLQGSIVQIGKALNDPIKGVTALRRVGVSFSQEQIAQIANLQKSGNLIGAQALIMGELQKEFGGAAQAMANPFTRMSNMLGEIGESVGMIILPALNEMATFVAAELVPQAIAWAESFKFVGSMLVDWVRVGIDFVRDGVAILGFAMENWQAIAEYAFVSAQLAAVSFIEDVKFFFTGVLPPMFSWFGDNWFKLWGEAVVTVITAMANIQSNIFGAFSEIWAFIASGGEDAMEFAFVPLLNGFKSTLGELPDIPDRAITDLEERMQGKLAGIGTDLGEKLGQSLIAAAAPVLDKPEFTPPQLGTDFEGGDAKAGKKTGAGAFTKGSKEALSSIFGNDRKADSDKQAKLVKLSEKLLKEQEAQTGLLEQLAEDESELIEIG